MQHDKNFFKTDRLTTFSRLKVIKTFHSEHEKKKQNLKHWKAMAQSNMEYKTLHTPGLFCKKGLMRHALKHKNKFECDMFEHV